MKDQLNRFFLLDSVIGWRMSKRENLYEDPTGVSLQKIPGSGELLVDTEGNFGGLDYPTGLAVDKDRNIYIADTEKHTINKFDFCKKEFETLNCLGGEGGLPRQLNSPRGLAISSNDNLYVADSGNHRIQVFSLKGLVLRAVWGAVSPAGKPVEGTGDGEFNEPADIAIDSRGNVYVVDKGNNRIQKFSGNGKFILKFGEEGDAEGKFKNPTHIAIDGKDRVYIIDDKDYVQIFDSEGNVQEYTIEAAGPFTPLAIAIDAEGNVYVGDGTGKSVHKFSCEGNMEKGFAYAGHSVGFAGETSYLIVDDDGALYASLKDMGFVTSFEPEESLYEKEGYFISEPLDSETYKCQWHKILVGADFPEGTNIEVQTYTADSEKDIGEIDGLSDFSWSARQINAKDSLILSPPGRYLWLKVTVKSNVKTTPILKTFRAYYPRVSYLQYLPKVYQEDDTSRSFLERFLSIFETTLSGFENEITNIAQYFNPLSTPKEFLNWLASWIALVLDENWSDDKKRKLIRLAPELYKKRGTLEGLKDYIKIYTGVSPAIIEHYKLRKWTFLGESVLGCNTTLWGKGIMSQQQLNNIPDFMPLTIWGRGFAEQLEQDEYSTISNFRLISPQDPMMDIFNQYAHRFSVVLPSSFCDGKKKERAIRNIVDVEKPAHTQYSILQVDPRFRVGVQSTIGVDSIIASYPETFLGSGSTLGIDSILGATSAEKAPPTLRIGKKSRIGVDTTIN